MIERGVEMKKIVEQSVETLKWCGNSERAQRMGGADVALLVGIVFVEPCIEYVV